LNDAIFYEYSITCLFCQEQAHARSRVGDRILPRLSTIVQEIQGLGKGKFGKNPLPRGQNRGNPAGMPARTPHDAQRPRLPEEVRMVRHTAPRRKVERADTLPERARSARSAHHPAGQIPPGTLK